MQISEHFLDRLRAVGLVVPDPFVSDHAAFPDGVIVGKPSTLKGNSIPGYEWGWLESGIVLDAPVVKSHHRDGLWFVTVHEFIPGPGPGAFVNRWDTPEEAASDIINYFLGDPARMEVKRLDREDILANIARLANKHNSG
jgi:hypothetical protein